MCFEENTELAFILKSRNTNFFPNEPQLLHDTDPGQQDPLLWQEPNSRGLQSPVEEKGRRGHSLKGRALQPLP